MNGQKYYRVYPLLLAGAFVSALLSPATVQAMPGMTATEAVGATSSPEGTAFAEFEPLYRQHCAACHGDNGDGKSRAQRGLRPPPRDSTTAEAWQELNRARMISAVTHGRPNTAMVGWEGRLDATEIAGVVDYVRSAFMRDPALLAAAQERFDPLPAALAPLNSSKREGRSGRDIYKRNCSACHGDKGNGSTWTQSGLNPPPRDFTASEARDYLTRERMITSVTYGRSGTAMMPFNSRLSADEISAVVDYIRADFMRLAAASNGEEAPRSAAPHQRQHPGRGHTAGAMPQAAGQPPVSHATPPPPAWVASDMSHQLPHGLTGDVAAGREFYMANCATCHGVRGDGHGPRSAFITPRPRNFLGERARNTLNRPALFRAIAVGLPGTVMPSWNKVLSNQEIANVTEFVFQTFIQREHGDGKGEQSESAAATATESSAVPGKPSATMSAPPPAVERSAATSTAAQPVSPTADE